MGRIGGLMGFNGFLGVPLINRGVGEGFNEDSLWGLWEGF